MTADSDPYPIITNSQSGGASLTAGRDLTIDGDVIGRDKIVTHYGYTAEQVDALLNQISITFQPRPFDGRCPYLGLAAFSEDEAERFFGRETLVSELLTRVQHTHAIFIAGPSGSGKSSLVRAGLIPALKKNRVVGSDHWLYETLKPGRAPLDELGRVTAGLAGNLAARKDIQERGLTDAMIFQEWVDIGLKDDLSRRAVIVVDQFEEIFTQTTKENERAAFLNLLTQAAGESGRIILVFTLRSDFISNCAPYPELNALLSQQFLQVGAMTRDELWNAIARPAIQVGLPLDPLLVEQIVNDVRGEPGALPLMQFALQDLFEAEKHQGRLTLDGYLARGGLHKALERHADTEFQQLSDAEKQLARTIFSGLIEIGRGPADTKRTALFDELVPPGIEPMRVKDLVTKLANARLISTDERDGQETVTLAHERLLDAWEWLRRLVNEQREAIALRNEIAQDANDWEGSGRSADYLYRGARLALARARLQAQDIHLHQGGARFIEASLRAHRSARWQRIMTPIAVVLTAGLLLGAGILIYREGLRQRALSVSQLVPVQNLALRFEPFEVTNQRFRWCVDALACTPPPATSKYYEAGGEQLPVTDVDFFQARDFCGWQSRRLPTLDEWKLAATNNAQTLWPWGDQPDPQPGYANLDYEQPALIAQIEPVGHNDSEQASGVHDLIGNVWEWTTTLSDNEGRPVGVWQGLAHDTVPFLIIAGGSYELTFSGLVSTKSSVPAPANSRGSDRGFRCVE